METNDVFVHLFILSYFVFPNKKLQPALHSGNEDFHLRFKGKKGSEGNKQNEMEGKCLQNSNCIGFMLIGFLK